MKKPMLFLIALFATIFFTNDLLAQRYDCAGDAGDLYVVNAQSGLALRDAPSLYSNKISAVPYGKSITVCDQKGGLPENIEGVDGNWVKAYYRGKSGWMFDGFLKQESDIDVIHAESWVSGTLPLDKEYMALYQSNDNQFDPLFELVDYSFSVDTVHVDGQGSVLSAYINDVKKPVLLIAGLKPGKQEDIIGRKFDSKFLFPGESVFLGTDKATYHVYAKGSIVSSKSPEDSNPFSMIRNYELHVRQQIGGEIKDELLYKMDLPAWMGDGYDGGVFLEWIGDLDGDNKLDMLLSTTNSKHCWEVVFFLSSKAERGHLLRQVSKYEECDGC